MTLAERHAPVPAAAAGLVHARARMAAGDVVLLSSTHPDEPCALAAVGHLIRPAAVNAMARTGAGMLSICLPPTAYERFGLRRLDPAAVAGRPFAGWQFVEASRGVTTGISATDRTVTIRAACASDAQPGDLRAPGHVLIAPVHDGGVLAHAGLREAASDLARLATGSAAAVACPVLDEAGVPVPSRRATATAAAHGLAAVGVGDLVAHRLRTDPS